MKAHGEAGCNSPSWKCNMPIKPFKYRIRGEARPEYSPSGVNRVGQAETLTGRIQGKAASDIEERMARAFDKLKIQYEFRARITSTAVGAQRLTSTMANLPGELEIDHLLYTEQITPVLIDGEIAHFMTQYQRIQDIAKTALINAYGEGQGWHPVIRVPFTEIRSQEAADSVARRILFGSYFPQNVS